MSFILKIKLVRLVEPKELHYHKLTLVLWPNLLLLHNPPDVLTRHRNKIHWFCVINWCENHIWERLIAHQNSIFCLTMFLLLPLHRLLFLLGGTIGNATHSLSDHAMNKHLLRMIEAYFGGLNTCVKVIHAHMIMQLSNTINQAEDMGMKRRESLVNTLLRWHFILKVEGGFFPFSHKQSSWNPSPLFL